MVIMFAHVENEMTCGKVSERSLIFLQSPRSEDGSTTHLVLVRGTVGDDTAMLCSFVIFLKHLTSSDSPPTGVRVRCIYQKRPWAMTVHLHGIALVGMERDTPVIGLFSNAECYDIAFREVLPKFEAGQQNRCHST